MAGFARRCRGRVNIVPYTETARTGRDGIGMAGSTIFRGRHVTSSRFTHCSNGAKGDATAVAGGAHTRRAGMDIRRANPIGVSRLGIGVAGVTSRRGRHVCHGILAGRGSAIVTIRTSGRIAGWVEFGTEESGEISGVATVVASLTSRPIGRYVKYRHALCAYSVMACRTGLSDRRVSKKHTEERRVILASRLGMTPATVTVVDCSRSHRGNRNVVSGLAQRINPVMTSRALL